MIGIVAGILDAVRTRPGIDPNRLRVHGPTSRDPSPEPTSPIRTGASTVEAHASAARDTVAEIGRLARERFTTALSDALDLDEATLVADAEHTLSTIEGTIASASTRGIIGSLLAPLHRHTAGLHGQGAPTVTVLAGLAPEPPTTDEEPTSETDEGTLAGLITTRARAYLHRIARGLTPSQLASRITVTAPERSCSGPDHRSTTSGACRTRPRPPNPLEGRPAAADQGGNPHGSTADPKRGEDEV